MNTATTTTTRLRTAFAGAIAASTLCAAPHASGENLNYDASGVATPLWSDTAGWKTEGGTHKAHSNFRAMPICLNVGQGVGVAAAIAAERGILPRDVPAADIQSALRRQGVAP